MKFLYIVPALLLALTASAQQQKNEKITVDSMTRTFVTYIAQPANPGDKMPIIVSLHGRLGTGRGQMSFAEFRPIAVKEHFIIVCPDGIDHSWNDGRPTPAQKRNINDVKFIGQLITYIVNTYNGDPKRVYVTGMSNGGFMSSRLACQLSDRIAAVAVVGASMDKDAGYAPTKPMPIMYIQGTKDPLVPYGGGSVKSSAGGAIYGHEDVLKLWIAADGCETSPIFSTIADSAGDGTSLTREEYINKSTGVKVIGYTVTNGGHTWPGGTQYLPKFLVGVVSHNMNACQVIWDFFKQYSLN